MTGVTTGSPGPTGAKAGRTIVRHPAIGGTLGRMTVGIGETIAPMTGANGATVAPTVAWSRTAGRSEEHTSELQSLMRISYAVFCLKKKIRKTKAKNNKTM